MNNTALLIIDVQKGFDDPCWGVRNNPSAESNIALLLSHWRNKNLPVIHIQHCSSDPSSVLQAGLPGNEFKELAMPLDDEAVFTKSVNSAFIGTDLESHLLSHHIDSLVVVGLTTDHCVSTTVRMAGNLGFTVTLVADATATFDRLGHNGAEYSAEYIHNIHLASLNGEFCMVLSTEEVVSTIS